MAGSQIPTSVTIIDNLKGYQALSLTEYTTSAAADIAAGSIVEIAGAFFTFVADETPTGWSAISTGSTAYIALTPSGTAGSQIVSSGYVSTAPTWRDDHQGWYASAGSTVRVVARVFKAGATSYYPKFLYKNFATESYRQSGKQIFTSSGYFHVPLGVDQVYLTGCAAGGNGGVGENDGTSRGGGGGGAGEIIYKKSAAVSPGDAIAVTIGAVGSITSFGALTLNYGLTGANGSTGGAGGAGGALGFGTTAGATGGTHLEDVASDSGFALGGSATSSQSGGGGAGGLGLWGNYLKSTSGVSASLAGKSGGAWGGGGGGGGKGTDISGGAGGSGGYGSGGGGGGPNSGAGSGGIGGAGGPAIIIVEW